MPDRPDSLSASRFNDFEKLVDAMSVLLDGSGYRDCEEAVVRFATAERLEAHMCTVTTPAPRLWDMSGTKVRSFGPILAYRESALGLRRCCE